MIAGEVDASDPNIIQEIIDQFAVEKIPAIAIAPEGAVKRTGFQRFAGRKHLGQTTSARHQLYRVTTFCKAATIVAFPVFRKQYTFTH